MATLALHEAVPGQHFQVALQQEIKTRYDYFERLNDAMLRAMRLIVDTGLHTKNGSREQAIEYMLENSSLAPSDVQSEVERYIANSAQALACKLGQRKLSELRKRARRQLGRKFEIKEFHSVVLRDGSMPLDVLDATIQDWIDAQRDLPNAGR